MGEETYSIISKKKLHIYIYRKRYRYFFKKKKNYVHGKKNIPFNFLLLFEVVNIESVVQGHNFRCGNYSRDSQPHICHLEF